LPSPAKASPRPPSPAAPPKSAPRANAATPPPEPLPPHGTDSDEYRAWALTHASDDLFRELYAGRADRIRRKHLAGVRLSSGDFLDRLAALCPES